MKELIGGKIGLWEILLVLAVALIVFGPAKLP
ncbi:MAG: twin-arginine translocase TatA/TatE family subunit, partial [Thermodesulfovibrionia bacterium]|nr:twin-arginine translocase TatA/TatE family subunit [Thermodesulfovibrionia bacterium]